jgi:glutathione peroxidase-family protein
MSIFDDVEINALDGAPLDLRAYDDRAVLVVNVASKCGLTPQYAGLEELHERFRDRGFSVLGVPCNQFGGQEPGTPDEIATFCSTTYGVTFPLTEKVEVNGEGRGPVQPDGRAHRRGRGVGRRGGAAGLSRRAGRGPQASAPTVRRTLSVRWAGRTS